MTNDRRTVYAPRPGRPGPVPIPLWAPIRLHHGWSSAPSRGRDGQPDTWDHESGAFILRQDDFDDTGWNFSAFTPDGEFLSDSTTLSGARYALRIAAFN